MAVLPGSYKLTAVLYTVVVAVAFILNAGRLMLDKIGTLLKAQYRAEKQERSVRSYADLHPTT